MPKFDVEHVAIYNVVMRVEADSQDEAEDVVKYGVGEIVDQTYDRVHPETEFFVSEADD